MDLLITLIVYILFFALLHLVAVEILKLLKADPIWFTVVKLVLLVLLLLFIWGLVAGVDYLPGLHHHPIRP